MNPRAVLMVAGVAAVGYVAWRGYKAGAGISQAATQAWNDAAQFVEQGAANVQSAVANTVTGPFQQGQAYAETGERPYAGSKAWLYSDYAYTGNDPATGAPVLSGEWYGDAEARRYDAAQIEHGTPPAATSINGAAFGVYPSAGIRNAEVNDRRQIDRIMERQASVQPEGSW